jgi:hypothetical protein
MTSHDSHFEDAVCNGTEIEEEVEQDDPDKLHDEMKEDLP